MYNNYIFTPLKGVMKLLNFTWFLLHMKKQLVRIKKYEYIKKKNFHIYRGLHLDIVVMYQDPTSKMKIYYIDRRFRMILKSQLEIYPDARETTLMIKKNLIKLEKRYAVDF